MQHIPISTIENKTEKKQLSLSNFKIGENEEKKHGNG